MKKEFYKLEFIRNFTDHESEIRIIYCDDFDTVVTESGGRFYVCKFSDGRKYTISCDQFDDYHVVMLYREEKSPE